LSPGSDVLCSALAQDICASHSDQQKGRLATPFLIDIGNNSKVTFLCLPRLRQGLSRKNFVSF